MTLYSFCINNKKSYKDTLNELLENNIIGINKFGKIYSKSKYFDNSRKDCINTRTNKVLINEKSYKYFIRIVKTYNKSYIKEFQDIKWFMYTLAKEIGDKNMEKLLELNENIAEALDMYITKKCYTNRDTIKVNGIKYNPSIKLFNFTPSHDSRTIDIKDIDIVKAFAVLEYFNKIYAKKGLIFPRIKYTKNRSIIAYKELDGLTGKFNGKLGYAFSENIIPKYNTKEYYKLLKDLVWIIAMNKRYEEKYRRGDIDNKSIFHWTTKDVERCKNLNWWDIWYDYEVGYTEEEQINPCDRFNDFGKLIKGQRKFV